MMKGYDESQNILLPPRLPGEDLPAELLQFYEDHKAPPADEETKPTTSGMEGSKLSFFVNNIFT